MTRSSLSCFANVVPEWRWVPRFEHLLIDNQTQQSAESTRGALAARLAQIAMMAAFREAREGLLDAATRLMGELYRAVGFEGVAKHVEYALATQPDEHRAAFIAALRRNVPGRGGDVMNYVEQLIERGRREGLQEGKLDGQIRTIEGFLGRDVPVVYHRSGHRDRRGRLSGAQSSRLMIRRAGPQARTEGLPPPRARRPIANRGDSARAPPQTHRRSVRGYPRHAERLQLVR